VIDKRCDSGRSEPAHPGTLNRNHGDQAERYSTGNLREVYFYPDQVQTHTKRTYHPGKW
jgi:acyl-homoserine-lactone acylase